METTSEWVKFGKVNQIYFLPRDTICFNRGCYLQFIHIITNDVKIYGANNFENGEGVSCFTGHKSLPVFAFAEESSKPRIFVKTYPSFELVSELPGECVEGYLELAFSEADFLISQGNLPFFVLVVWNWRKGEKLSRIESGVTVKKQIIRCSYGSPVSVAHMGVATRILKVWDIYTCGRSVEIRENVVKVRKHINKFSAMLWTTDGTLFVLDVIGNVYMLNSDYSLTLAIEWENRGPHLTCFTWYKGGLLVSGSDGKLVHFKKQETWSFGFEIIPEEPMKRLIVSNKEVLIAVNIGRDILLYSPEENNFTPITKRESRFTDFCLIYPVGEYIVTLTRSKYLSVCEVRTGNLRGSIELKGEALAMSENPVYPYVGVAFQSGLFQIISIYNPDNPKPLMGIHLTRKPLNKVYFASNARIIVVGHTYTGEIFVLEGYPGIKITVQAHIEVGQAIADYMLVPSRTCLRLFVIAVTSVNFKAGSKFIRYCIIKGEAQPTKKLYELEHVERYTRIFATDRENRDRVFYAMPFDSKFIHELETKRGDVVIRVIDKICTGHQMRKIKMHIGKDLMLSFGFDGLVIVRTLDLELYCVVMPHHRKDGGVTKAYIDPQHKYIISLGRESVLTCTSLSSVEYNEEKVEELRQILATPKYQLMFLKSRYTVLPAGISHRGQTWLEAQQADVVELERKQCEEERNDILEEFRRIQKEVQKKLTANIEGPENEKIDIRFFDMDEELTASKRIECEEKCKQTNIELELLIEAQDRVSNWIKTNCWDNMSTKGKTIWGIFNNLGIDNYPLPPEDRENEAYKHVIEEYRKIQQSSTGYFYPWIPKSQTQIEQDFAQDPVLKAEGDMFLQTLIEESEEKEEEDQETLTAFAGSITHFFVEKSHQHYSQEEIQTYLQLLVETILSLHENEKLKIYFNKEFETIFSQKERDMKLIEERNNRLRHIISELNFFSVDKFDIDPIDPEWHPSEYPETIVKVEDNEVPITPYISPSEQLLLDQKAAEAERIRLALLADDFRERALMKMMNGVLEMRWEDELKKDIPKPKCMLEKKPEEYKEDDLRAVKEYEEKVKQLHADREYYKMILESEYGKLSNTLREGVRKFNSRMDDFLQVKIKIESAILQEKLKINKCRLAAFNQSQLTEKEQELIIQKMETEKEVEELQKLMPALQERIAECRQELETVTSREKVVEKLLKRDLQDASPVVQEQGNKLFKRRPKTNYRNISSPMVLFELARCIATHESSLIANLNNDALEFIKAMDNLDSYVGVPSAVDEHSYAIICRIRRLKVEIELKSRALGLMLTESESTLQTYQRLLAQKRELVRKLEGDTDKLRSEKINKAQDIEIVLVLKQGYVEINRTGRRSDFDEAILIPRREIESVNEIILKNGSRKLKAMKQNMHFHRTILTMEWEHTRLRMIVADLQERLQDIESVSVTKEMQSYLKAMARGFTVDLTPSFEEEVERLTQSYEKMINDKKTKAEEIQQKIDAIDRSNKELDKKIAEINIDVCEFHLQKDNTLEEKEQQMIQIRMSTLLKRSNLVKELQDNHSKILIMQTELELLRLRVYPTLEYKILT